MEGMLLKQFGLILAFMLILMPMTASASDRISEDKVEQMFASLEVCFKLQGHLLNHNKAYQTLLSIQRLREKL
ncbi:MAG: hypothetical protein QG575_520 [Euryarchaeota archaeon]|nr:hypothetical protein [Euryarchaeota archaeon]